MPDAGRTDSAPPASPPAVPLSASPAAPLATWLLLQLGLLALAAFQIPLSDQYARPPERLAVELMTIGQLILSSLLFPWLFRGRTQSTLILVSVWPFIQLAGFLSAQELLPILLATLFVTGWLLILGIWGDLLRTSRARSLGAGVLSSLAILGPVLWYLRAEFASASDPPLESWFGVLGPVMMHLSVVEGSPGAGRGWIVLAGMLLGSLMAWGIINYRSRRGAAPTKPPTSSHLIF